MQTTHQQHTIHQQQGPILAPGEVQQNNQSLQAVDIEQHQQHQQHQPQQSNMPRQPPWLPANKQAELNTLTAEPSSYFAICTIVKDQHQDLLEWLEWHR